MSVSHPFSDIPAAKADVKSGQSANDPIADALQLGHEPKISAR